MLFDLANNQKILMEKMKNHESRIVKIEDYLKQEQKVHEDKINKKIRVAK